MEPSPEDASSASLHTSPPKITRALALVQIVATLVAQPQLFGRSVTDSFALLPMSTIGASKVWNVITAGFFDINPIKALVNVSLFLTVGRWIETSWGAPLCLLYLVLVNAVAGICTYFAVLAAFLLTRIDRFLFSPVATTNGMCTALLVAVKQLIPEHEIGINGMKLQANFLPILYVSLVTILFVVGISSLGDLSFTLAAFQFSWIYLRYFQRRNGVRGDPSEAFSYASMFPEPLRTVVAIFANFTFVLFKPIITAVLGVKPENEQPQQQAPVSKAATVDAERRRQRALRALDERMNVTTNSDEKVDNPV